MELGVEKDNGEEKLSSRPFELAVCCVVVIIVEMTLYVNKRLGEEKRRGRTLSLYTA